MKPPRLPAGLRAQRLEVRGESLVVLSWPLAREQPDLSALTDAERDVATRLLAGSSDAEIATARGTSARTVAKQAASLYRKLGVAGRRELWAWAAAQQAGALTRRSR